MTPEQIREARESNPKTRERDFARAVGVSEAQFVAAWCGKDVTRITVDMDRIFNGLVAVGEVMSLTRNESAVHEKIGVFDNFYSGKHASMMLGSQIDTRMFPRHYAHAFMVEKSAAKKDVKRSLQFFDSTGTAVQKIHLRPNSNLKAWHQLLDPMISQDQSQHVNCDPLPVVDFCEEPQSVAEDLRKHWEAMTDTHQLVFIIRNLKLSRHQAVQVIGDDLAWQVDNSSVEAMMRHAANEKMPIMCFVGSRGCIQIHSGTIKNIHPMGTWLNVMDPTFHLHLRADQIAQSWIVRKPADRGHVTSMECYDSQGNLIIQFSGKRVEGTNENPNWRFIVENLPRTNQTEAA